MQKGFCCDLCYDLRYCLVCLLENDFQVVLLGRSGSAVGTLCPLRLTIQRVYLR
jgi:hypothetical protein